MKLSLEAVLGSAALLLAAQPCLATTHHRHLHMAKRNHNRAHDNHTKELKAKGSGTCAFPSDEGLVAITPGKDNAGWAMSPDQPCTGGSYCPYACPSGQVMAQWKDGSTYATAERMDGGLYCGSDGKAVKPFDSKPLCVDGTGAVKAVNKVGSVVSFCQTVLPGNEDILIPNDVQDTLTLAVPDVNYWQSTASHFYINPPGTDSDTGCHWGDSSKPIGNWAPFVAGANTDSSGLTYVKLGINPIWQGSSLYSSKPSFGLKIECPSGDCVGLPCSVDGDGVSSDEKTTGAGGSDFCVATVPKGSTANIVIYNLDGSSGGSSSSSTTSSEAEPTSTSSVAPTLTSTSSSSTSTSTSTQPSTTLTTSSKPTTSFVLSTSFSVTSSSSVAKTTSSSNYLIGGIFQENGTTTSSSISWVSPSSTGTSAAGGESSSSSTAATPSESKKSESSAAQGNGAVAGLIVAFVAAACLL